MTVDVVKAKKPACRYQKDSDYRLDQAPVECVLLRIVETDHRPPKQLCSDVTTESGKGN